MLIGPIMIIHHWFFPLLPFSTTEEPISGLCPEAAASASGSGAPSASRMPTARRRSCFSVEGRGAYNQVRKKPRRKAGPVRLGIKDG